MNKEVANIVAASLLIGLMPRALPRLSSKIDNILDVRIVRMLIIAAVLYLKTKNVAVSLLVPVLLFIVVGVVNMIVSEGFEPEPVDEQKEYGAPISEQQDASESIRGIVSDLTEKAAQVQTFYGEICQCKK